MCVCARAFVPMRMDASMHVGMKDLTLGHKAPHQRRPAREQCGTAAQRRLPLRNALLQTHCLHLHTWGMGVRGTCELVSRSAVGSRGRAWV